MEQVRIIDVATRDAFEKPAVWGWWAYDRDGEEIDHFIGYSSEEAAKADALRTFPGSERVVFPRVRDGETGELLPRDAMT